MSKKSVLFLLILIFLSSATLAHAGLVINEIMYDLSGSDSTASKSREWIEIYNNGTTDVTVDGATWRVYDGGANRTINGQVSFSIPASAYVIFAGDKDTFLLDHPGFTSTVYDTGITSLNNTGASIKILDQDGNVLDTVDYASSQGAAGDGNTLQKISGAWSAAAPTPGEANEAAAPSYLYPTPVDTSGGGTPTGNTGNSGTETKPKTVEPKKIQAQITAKATGFAGVPLSFTATAFGTTGEEMRVGTFFWNFGDGDSKETKANFSEKFSHTFFYPGEYTVLLEYNINYFSEVPDAVDKLTIKIVGTDIVINNVGDEKDFFVELANNTSYDADISRWILKSDRMTFTLARNTILGAKKKLILSPLVTNFSISDKISLKLFTPQMTLAYDYNLDPAEPEPQEGAPPKDDPKSETEDQDISVLESESEVSETPVPPLAAAVIESTEGEDQGSGAMIPTMVFVGFLGLSSGALYFIRARKGLIRPGDDFELLDE